MRLTETDKLEAYTFAMHQLIGAMANVQAMVRLAKQGEIDLMDPKWLEKLDRTVNGEHTTASMDPITTHQRRMIEARLQGRAGAYMKETQ